MCVCPLSIQALDLLLNLGPPEACKVYEELFKVKGGCEESHRRDMITRLWLSHRFKEDLSLLPMVCLLVEDGVRCRWSKQ